MSGGSVTREEFEALSRQVIELRAQLAELAARAAIPVDAKISEDLVTVLAAAVAAFLGKRATIKFVRRVQPETGAWLDHGRATIVASHRMPHMRGW
jgi:methylmalonyl-CoA carboxyltransferase large subunit